MRTALRHCLPTCPVALLLLLVAAAATTLLSCCWAASPEDNIFTIRHENARKCIQVKKHQIIADDCKETKEALWTWVSEHRLFNLGSKKCLGLDATKPQDPLKMVDCDSDITLWWRCADATLYSASQNKLTLKDGIITVKVDSSDTWRRSNSSDVVCKIPYREIYTRGGNSYGKPCEFPFLLNKTWHHDCLHSDTVVGEEWCSTTSNFDQDGKWGVCLKPEDGCQNTWEQDAESGNCYQLNMQAFLSWKEAYVSCQRQGGDLLSISSISELHHIQAKDGIAGTFWIGLNQLDMSGGWQWSDHTPLSFINWSTVEMQDSSLLDATGCVAMNADTGDWKSYPCETGLPYVCKKQINNTELEFPGVQSYAETECEPEWNPHNGFCYMLMSGSASWKDAYQSCNASNSSLISIHSLADVELAVTKLHNETKDKVWMGLKNEDTPALFKWADGSKVVFTYWEKNEPKIPSNSTPNCVAYSGKMGRWSILPCEEQQKYVCMKKGKVLDKPKPDKNCSSDEGWSKHGDYCYKVEKNEVSFGKICNLTITNRFEQEFINSLIRKHSRVEGNYFWTGLQDIKSSGEYTWGSTDGNHELLTYTNWDSFQPEIRGGCVVMSSRRQLGKWEVKDCKTFKAYSICKKYIGPKKEQYRPPKVTDPCPQGWQGGSGLACYKFFHKERVLRTRTWEEAERFCEELGGHLPSFSHLEEMREFHTILREIISNDRWVWVGLNKRNPESQGSWQWSDNKPVSTVIMPAEFREDDYDTRDCAALKTLKAIRRLYYAYSLERRDEDFYLKPFHCSSKLEWVCQIPKGASVRTPEWYKPDEDRVDQLNIDGSEFWFVPDKHLTYQEAALYCSENGSDLAYVTSFTALTAILNRIANLTDGRQSWWVKYTPPTSRYHSLFSVFSYSHERRFRDCWHISYQSWYRDTTINCNTKLPFICEKYNASLLETHDPGYRPPQRKCSENWVLFLDKCFRTVPPQELKFKEANDYCNSHGGFLPSIKSQAEQDFITSLLPGLPQSIWIGLHFRIHLHENKWVDGSTLEYSNFHPLLQGKLRKVQLDLFDEEVNNQCGVLLNNPKSSYLGTWNFTSCADTHSVALCESKSEPDALENQTRQVLNISMSYLDVTYTIILKNLTWFDARQECLQNNMHLVSITNEYQQAFLATQAAHHNYPLWIGLSSKDDGVHYHWSDRKHVSFSRWSEEDEDLVDDCVYLDRDGFWKTADCYSEKPGVVCYLSGKTEETELHHESIKCPHRVKNTPWIAFHNSCYTFVITKERWKEFKSKEAHRLCQTMNSNASVLNIQDEHENDFVVEQLHYFNGLAQWLWLGLIYEAGDNSLKWYDGTRLSYNNWRLGRPYIKSDNFVAGVNQDGLWDIYNNTENWRALQLNLHSILVCKIEMGPREEKSPLPTSLSYKNNTYWILQEQLSWYDAWKECKLKGSDLASIHSASVESFLEKIVKNDGFPLWIGLSSHNESNSDFEWSDGSAFDYKPLKYDRSPPPGSCVSLDTKGLWNRMECTGHADGAICYSSSNKMQSKQAEMSTKCPKTTSGTSQWIQYKDHCYAFDMAFYNFSTYTADAAKEVCKKFDPSATLLTIKDAEENKFVTTHLREYYFITGQVWLGMHPDARSLKWLDGSEVKYTNWAKGNENAKGDCNVIFSTNGTWSKSYCKTVQSRVVCKAPQVANQVGGAIAVAVLIIVVILAGLTCFLYKKKQLHWGGFSSVRYERGMYEDETDSMFTRDGD